MKCIHKNVLSKRDIIGIYINDRVQWQGVTRIYAKLY